MPGLWCHSQHPSKSRPTRRGATNLWPALLQPPPPHAIQTLPSTSKTTGSIEELIPISYHWAFFPSPPLLPPTWCFSEFSCLFVCLFCSVSMLASRFDSLPSLFHKHKIHFFSLSHTNTLKHSSKYTLPPTLNCSDDAGRGLFMGCS